MFFALDVFSKTSLENMGVQEVSPHHITDSILSFEFFMVLGINQVTYSDCKFCQSVCPGFASLGTSR